ncbi:MAG: hypothetical protein GX443_18920 [Deltaproteobacteria bacterium]|nr:hypothetical protein [Deltaproteobacteria bacterium]
MAEKRSQAEETGKTKSSGSRGKQKSRKPGSSQGAKGTKPAGEKGRGTVEQIEAIFSKILELAETGVGLGVNVLSRLSSYAQSETAYRQGEDERHGGGGYPPPHMGETGMGTAALHREPRGDPDSGMGTSWNPFVTNRISLQPGRPFQISFCINNDSDASEKRLHLEAEDFVGATTGFRMERHLFSVQPAEKAIAPLDFDKFVLTGNIPADALEDSYNGWVRITGDEEIRLPVILMVGLYPQFR